MSLRIPRPARRFARDRLAWTALPAVVCALALGLAVGAHAQSVTTDVGPLPAERDYWLLTEFDWGDDDEVVDESVQISPGFLCYKVRHRCQLTRVSVDGEDVLARFFFDPNGLKEIAFVTPELDRSQAEAHLARVGKVLTGYVSRFKGKPDLEFGPPDVAAIGKEIPTPLAYWKRPEMEIRVEARRQGEAFVVGAFFTKPGGGAEPETAPRAAPEKQAGGGS